MTFAIIITVVGTTMIFTQDFGHEKNESKVWVVSNPILSNVFAQTSESTNKSLLNQTMIDVFENDRCKNEMKWTDLSYSFTGNGKIRSMCSIFESRSILVFVDVFEDDQIKIMLPKKLLSDLDICTTRSSANSLFVLLDNNEVHNKIIYKKMDYNLVINMTKGSHVIEFVGFLSPTIPYHGCLSPKIQQDGWGPDRVMCQDDLIRIKKISDGSIACVKPETSLKLIARGWGEK